MHYVATAWYFTVWLFTHWQPFIIFGFSFSTKVASYWSPYRALFCLSTESQINPIKLVIYHNIRFRKGGGGAGSIIVWSSGFKLIWGFSCYKKVWIFMDKWIVSFHAYWLDYQCFRSHCHTAGLKMLKLLTMIKLYCHNIILNLGGPPLERFQGGVNQIHCLKCIQ